MFDLSLSKAPKVVQDRVITGETLQSEHRVQSTVGPQLIDVRFQAISGNGIQLPSDTDWQRLFLARATRRVRLDATISLDGTLWEVPVHLRGRQVQLRYEPFEWSVLEVWYQDKFAGLGRRCDKRLNAKLYRSTDYERSKTFSGHLSQNPVGREPNAFR